MGGLSQYDLSAQFAFIEEKEKAYEILYKMEELKNLEGWMLWWMPYDPRFENMRNEEEFNKIIQRQEQKYVEIRDEIDAMKAAGMF